VIDALKQGRKRGIANDLRGRGGCINKKEPQNVAPLLGKEAYPKLIGWLFPSLGLVLFWVC
jgi:hypothetical protein